jgi:hypothetical protein
MPKGASSSPASMIRAPFSLEKTEYKAQLGVIVYPTALHAALKCKPRIVRGAKSIEILPQHVRDRSAHLARHRGR